MADNNNSRTSTSTQIRNLYSDGLSYLNISFFNTNLSFKFHPFISKDSMGKSTYDMKNVLSTTVNFEGASALQQVAEDIINGKTQECNLPIPCAAGASLNLERKLGQDGKMETIFSITKNSAKIDFKFNTISYQTKENGQIVTKTIETGLKAFEKTIDGYLTGINADRHLDKLTEDFARLQEANNGGQQQQRGSYNNYNNSSKKNYNNNNNGYRKQYHGNNNFNQNQPGNNNWGQNGGQQPMSSYNIPN